MKIDIVSKNLELTPPLKEYIGEKVGSLDKFLGKLKGDKGPDFMAQVEVARSTRHHHKGSVYYAECNLRIPGVVLRASSETFDIRVAIDEVRDKLQKEIKKYKEQRKS